MSGKQADHLDNRRGGSRTGDSTNISSAGKQLHASQDSLSTSHSGSSIVIHPGNSLKAYSCISSRRSSRDEIPLQSSASSLTMMPGGAVTSITSSRKCSPSALTKLSSTTDQYSATARMGSHSSLIEAIKEVEGTLPPLQVTRKVTGDGDKLTGNSLSRTVSRTSSTITSPCDQPLNSNDTKKRSNLEKKWSTSSMEKSGSTSNKQSLVIQGGDAKNKIAQFSNTTADKSNIYNVGEKPADRPRELSFSAGQGKTKQSPAGTPSSKNIRELTEKWEVRSNSNSSFDVAVAASMATTAAAVMPQSSVTAAPSISRRSTQDTLVTSDTDNLLYSMTSSANTPQGFVSMDNSNLQVTKLLNC